MDSEESSDDDEKSKGQISTQFTNNIISIQLRFEILI